MATFIPNPTKAMYGNHHPPTSANTITTPNVETRDTKRKVWRKNSMATSRNQRRIQPWPFQYNNDSRWVLGGGVYPKPMPQENGTWQQQQQHQQYQQQLQSLWNPVAPFYPPRNCVALDCEMVGVGPGGKRSVLARASLVDFYGNCILDTFVRVQEKVTDYRTFVSGVRAEDLESSSAMSFFDCRRAVMDIIYGKVLVGHGLQNDLLVMNVFHPVYDKRDTSRYAPLMKMGEDGRLRSRKLRVLAKSVLGRSIQQDGEEHDSLIDARAAMDIYKAYQENWERAAMETYETSRENRGHDMKNNLGSAAALHSPLHVVKVMH